MRREDQFRRNVSPVLFVLLSISLSEADDDYRDVDDDISGFVALVVSL